MTAVIRPANAEDYFAWRALWDAYVAFYGTSVDEAVTAYTWQRCLDPDSPMFCRLAERDGEVIGFSLAVLHEGSWGRTPICYLEDLYVAEAQRGKGVGRALVADLIDLGQRSGWSRLYWHTREANAAARRLYESITPASGFIVYRVDL